MSFPFLNNDIYVGEVVLDEPKYGITFKEGIYYCKGGVKKGKNLRVVNYTDKSLFKKIDM